MSLDARLAKLETSMQPQRVARRFYLLTGCTGYTDAEVETVIREAGHVYDPEVDMAVVMVAFAAVGLPLKLVGTPHDFERAA